MLAKYKNITILSMSFNPDIVKGTIDSREFTAKILTNGKGQYFILDNEEYYFLDQFKIIRP